MMRRPSAQALIGAGVIAFSGVVAYQTARIPVSPLYSKVGPTVFPYMVAAGLFALGALLLVQAVAGTWGETDAEGNKEPPHWAALGWLGAGLLLNVALIGWLGFVIASTILFACTARAFGSRRLVRDVSVGVALALAAYLGFAKLLGISIGAGVLEGFL